jgi:sugar phosphate isomerase/epimerase
MAESVRLAINQTTNRLKWGLREAIEGYARADIRGIGVWRDKLEQCGVSEACKMLGDHGMTVTSLHRGGAFPASDERRRRVAIEHSRRAIDLAAEVGARCLVLFVGGLADGSKDIAGAREQVRDGIGELLPYARAASVPLAIEPQHPMFAADRACVNTLEQANDLCDQFGAGLGVVDVYHVWWDRNLEAQIDRAGGERIRVFQVSDWLVPTRHLMLDRGMMGDGIIDLSQIRRWIEASSYTGFTEVEILSAQNGGRGIKTMWFVPASSATGIVVDGTQSERRRGVWASDSSQARAPRFGQSVSAVGDPELLK